MVPDGGESAGARIPFVAADDVPQTTASMSATVSVVIGSIASDEALDGCLAALDAQRGNVEVLVFQSQPSGPELRSRYPWARYADRPGALVPELWRDGIDESTGDIVVLTIGQMIPAPDWIETIREQHRRFDAIGGAIDPAPGLGMSDRAEYFCRYARDMPPFTARETVDLAGDNAAYKRRLLERNRDLYRDGFWEPIVHHKLAGDGVVCWHTPEVLVRQGRSAGWRAFVRQRLAHGRKYGNQRGVDFSLPRNVAGVLGSPLVPWLMTYRVFRHVVAKRRHLGLAVSALPAIFLFNLVWAVAEARGHLDVLVRR